MRESFKHNVGWILPSVLFVCFAVKVIKDKWKEDKADTAAYVRAVGKARDAKNRFFLADPDSPLVRPDTFKGLSYFPVNPALRYTLRLLPLRDSSVRWLPTTQGTQLAFVPAGWVQIPLPAGGVCAAEIVYPSGDEGQWVLAFTDSTTGTETSRLGRYLDIQRISGHKVLLDFNLAYHPYCQYNPAMACPLPLPGNRLPMRVLAGERNGVSRLTSGPKAHSQPKSNRKDN